MVIYSSDNFLLKELKTNELVFHGSFKYSGSSYPAPGEWSWVTILNGEIEDAYTAKIELENLGLEVIQWAPWGIAVWSMDRNDYLKIQFPKQIRPTLNNLGSLTEVATELNYINYYLPRRIGFHKHFFIDNKGTYIVRNNRIEHPTQPQNVEFPSAIIQLPEPDLWLDMHVGKVAPYLLVLAARMTGTDFRPNVNKESVVCYTGKVVPEEVDLRLFRQELVKGLHLDRPSDFFRELNRLGLLEYLMPELHANIGCMQDERWHNEDVFDHLMRSVDACGRVGITNTLLKLAVLMHDVGKAATREETSSGIDAPQSPKQLVLSGVSEQSAVSS